ncbi:MAG: diguanylate cyclase, partial [Clostridiaceae bacterium]
WALDTLVEEESRKEYQAFWAAIRAGEAGGCAEVRMTNAEGALRWYAFTFSAIKNSAGKSVQAVITVRDITIAREKLNEYEHWRAMVSALIGKSAAYIEINLTTGAAERVEGRFALKQDGAKDAAEILRIFAENYVDCGDRVKFASFLSLPRLRELLIRGVTRSESDVRLQFPNGEARLCAVSVQMSYAPDTNDAKAIVAITDPGDSGSDMERLSDLAFRDGLSGLLNRTAARAAIEEALRFGGEEPVALFMLDIDNFKRVNDSMGHQQGDQALVRIGEILRGVFRATDVIARIGGDEFFVFLTGPSLGELVEPKAAALCDALSFSYSNGSASVPISVSVGVVTARSNQVDYDSLYREADLALYEAKNAGKDRYCIRRLDQTPEPGSNRSPGASYSVQLYSLLKYVDSGVALFAVGKTIEHLFSSGGGLPSNEPGCCGIDVVHPDDLNALVNLLHICAKQGTSFETVFRRRLGDGSYGWRHMRAERIPYVASQYPVVIAAVTDITELKRSAGELESIVAATPIGIAIVRFGERMEATFFNDALLNMFGFSYEQFRLIARDCSSMLLKDNLAQLHAAVARAENDGAPLEVVFRTASQHGLGKRHIHVRGVKVDEVNGVPAYLLLLTQLTA